MNYHARVMNVRGDCDTQLEAHGFKEARHACAEIAAEADMQIEQLLHLVALQQAVIDAGSAPDCECVYQHHAGCPVMQYSRVRSRLEEAQQQQQRSGSKEQLPAMCEECTEEPCTNPLCPYRPG